MELKAYVHRMSQPARAVLTFCKVNRIEFEEISVDMRARQHKSSEYLDFKSSENHAILIYLASAYPEVADHWYPSDLQKRAKVQSVLDWHHSNFRLGSLLYTVNTNLAPLLGLPLDPKAAAEGEKLLAPSLSKIESVWLTESGPFLVGCDQPSIADLSLVCEIMQLYVFDENDRNRILEPYKKVQKWIRDVKTATGPHFDEVHDTISKFRAMLKQMLAGKKSEA